MDFIEEGSRDRDEDDFIVEKIIGKRLRNGRVKPPSLLSYVNHQ